MKIHNPLFSTIIVLIQLFFSIKECNDLKAWRKANPDLDALMNPIVHYDTLFLFVVTIGIFEMLTESSWLKKVTRILLVCIVFGYQASKIIAINDLNFAIYNTAWFLAVISFLLILIKLGKQINQLLLKTAKK